MVVPKERMTPTEAAEVVLKGAIFTVCPLCDGNRVMAQNCASTVFCTWCEGKGVSVSALFKEACKVLEMPIPIRPLHVYAPRQRS